MILEEFDLEKHVRSEKAVSYAEGFAVGYAESICKRMLLVVKLQADQRCEDLIRAVHDPDFMEQLYQKYNIE